MRFVILSVSMIVCLKCMIKSFVPVGNHGDEECVCVCVCVCVLGEDGCPNTGRPEAGKGHSGLN